MPFTKRVSLSETPEQGADSVAPATDGSALPSELWTAMQDILDYIYDYRAAEYVNKYATICAH